MIPKESEKTEVVDTAQALIDLLHFAAIKARDEGQHDMAEAIDLAFEACLNLHVSANERRLRQCIERSHDGALH